LEGSEDSSSDEDEVPPLPPPLVLPQLSSVEISQADHNSDGPQTALAVGVSHTGGMTGTSQTGSASQTGGFQMSQSSGLQRSQANISQSSLPSNRSGLASQISSLASQTSGSNYYGAQTRGSYYGGITSDGYYGAAGLLTSQAVSCYGDSYYNYGGFQTSQARGFQTSQANYSHYGGPLVNRNYSVPSNVQSSSGYVQQFSYQSNLQDQVNQLKDRVKYLEEKVATMDQAQPGTMSASSDTGIPGLSPNQHVAISVITSNASIGWKVALRRVLMVVFGAETLARSCCKGRRNSTNQPLDASKVDAIKGYNKHAYSTLIILL